MKVGFLFPGQGSQRVGMGKDIYDKYEVARKVYDEVRLLTNIDVAKISFEGTEEVLNETKHTQLAILTNSLSILSILKEKKICAEISAGLSLGEYAALIYSNVISFEDGVKIVKKRGEYMQKYIPKGNWKMAAIIGLNEMTVQNICKKVNSGFVVPANYNSEYQIVISGEEKAIIEAQNIAKEMGAKKVTILNTVGPFHTEKLFEASTIFRKELDKIKFNRFNTKVIKNLDGEFYKDIDDIRTILEKHIIKPVRFSKTIHNMSNYGIDTFIEIGPRKNFI